MQTQENEPSFNVWVYRKVNSLLDEVSEMCFRGLYRDRADKCLVEIGAAVFQIRQTLRELELSENDIHPKGSNNVA